VRSQKNKAAIKGKAQQKPSSMMIVEDPIEPSRFRLGLFITNSLSKYLQRNYLNNLSILAIRLHYRKFEMDRISFTTKKTK